MNFVGIIGFIFGTLFPILIMVWLVSIVIAVCCLAKEEWHYKARYYLCWALFPFPLIAHPKRFGVIRSWLLFMISPCMMSVYYFTVLSLAVLLSIDYTSYGTPSSISYHTAEDLRKVTGIVFPDVVPVDSAYEDGYALTETIIKFVPKMALSVKFFQSLDKACKDDSCCWSKDNLGYYYNIYPVRPIDRTKGTHMRQVEVDGKMVNDWDGDFLSVRIPIKGDTIYVSEGWCL